MNVNVRDVPYVLPTRNPGLLSLSLPAWLDMGYGPVFAVIDSDMEAEFKTQIKPSRDVTFIVRDTYRGYYVESHEALQIAHRMASFAVVAGDDMWPDPNVRAQEIAAQCLEHFKGSNGIMQPIGDDLGNTSIICGSPWVGRDFAQTTYGGRGPWWLEYHSYYGDMELHDVAKLLDRLWKRKDLSQRHEHWSRVHSFNHNRQTEYHRRNFAISGEKNKAMYEERRRLGFPGHEPVPVGGAW